MGAIDDEIHGLPSLGSGNWTLEAARLRSGSVNAMARAADGWVPKQYLAENLERNCTAWLLEGGGSDWEFLRLRAVVAALKFKSPSYVIAHGGC